MKRLVLTATLVVLTATAACSDNPTSDQPLRSDRPTLPATTTTQARPTTTEPSRAAEPSATTELSPTTTQAPTITTTIDPTTTTDAQLTVGSSKAASQVLVTDSLAEGKIYSKFGDTVTVTLQIADEDDVPVADKGKRVTVRHDTMAADGSTTSGSSTYAFDAEGKIVLEYTEADSNENAVGQTAMVVLTLSNGPMNLPLQDEDGVAFEPKTYRWSDFGPTTTTAAYYAAAAYYADYAALAADSASEYNIYYYAEAAYYYAAAAYYYDKAAADRAAEYAADRAAAEAALATAAADLAADRAAAEAALATAEYAERAAALAASAADLAAVAVEHAAPAAEYAKARYADLAAEYAERTDSFAERVAEAEAEGYDGFGDVDYWTEAADFAEADAVRYAAAVATAGYFTPTDYADAYEVALSELSSDVGDPDYGFLSPIAERAAAAATVAAAYYVAVGDVAVATEYAVAAADAAADIAERAAALAGDYWAIDSFSGSVTEAARSAERAAAFAEAATGVIR